MNGYIDSSLSFPLPEAVSFVTASGGGALNGNIVEWTLGDVLVIVPGRKTVTVRVNSDITLGTVLEVHGAEINGVIDLVGYSAWAQAMTPVENNMSPLDLKIELNPALLSSGLQATVTLGNITEIPVFGINLQIQIPETLISPQFTGLLPLNSSKIINSSDYTDIFCYVACSRDATRNFSGFSSLSMINLAPGESRSVMFVVPFLADSLVSSIDAVAFSDDGIITTMSRSTLLPIPILNIEIDESHNPVMTGDTLTYIITYSNIAAVNSTNTTLRFPLPDTVNFMTASNGRYLNGNTIEWDLKTLPPHRGGQQTVTVSVNQNAIPGSLLEVDATEITGEVNGIDLFTRAQSVTRIANNIPFSFSVNTSSNPMSVNSSAQHGLTLTVENISNENIFDGILRVEMPTTNAFKTLTNINADVASAACNPTSGHCSLVLSGTYLWLFRLSGGN